MSRRGADEVSGSPQLQARLLRPAGPAQMSAVERDRLIVHLADKGWNHSKIGRAWACRAAGLGWRCGSRRAGLGVCVANSSSAGVSLFRRGFDPVGVEPLAVESVAFADRLDGQAHQHGDHGAEPVRR